MEAEKEVHVVDGGSGASLEEVVDDGGNHQFATDAVEVDEALVGVDDIFEVGCFVDDKGEVVVVVVFLIEAFDFGQRDVAVEVGCGDDSAREGAAHRHEVDFGAETGLDFGDGVAYLGELVMGEGAVDNHVVVAPRIVGGGSAFGSRACRAGDGGDVDVAVEEHVSCEGEEHQLDGHGYAAGVGDVTGAAHHCLAVEFGEAVDKVVAFGGHTEVAGEVNDAEFLGYGDVAEKFAGAPVGGAAEQHVDFVERGGTAERHVDFADETLMDVSDFLCGTFAAVDPLNGYVGVVDEDAQQFASGVT